MAQEFTSTSKRPAKALAKRAAVNWLTRREFGLTYLGLAAAVLLVSTLLWAGLGARLNLQNADQLVDPYLFSDWSTFHAATFPGAHTFLLKWPLFALLGVLHVSSGALTVMTVGSVLLTVGALAALLYRIERRPLYTGTLLLALAAVLLLVPAQPYAGGILPVNMAMLTTRNLEYVVYILSLMLLTRAASYRDKRYLCGVGLLALLVASDKLFLSISLGGAFLALVFYAFIGRWKLVTVSVRWFLASGIAGALAVLLLAGINLSGLTHIAGESGANPYGLVSDAKTVALAAMYAGLGLLTNFGANPAFDATQVTQLPLYGLRRLLSLSGPAYVINAAVLVFGLIAAVQLGRRSITAKTTNRLARDHHSLTALVLIWSTLGAGAVFVASNHYYAVDARYLALAVFAVFVALAVYSRAHKWQPEGLVGTGLVLLLAILCAVSGTLSAHHRSQSALQPVADRNARVAAVLSRHHVDVLVGDYWRVLPIKTASQGKINIAPLADCTTLRTGLSSQAWQPDLRKHSFAYLVSIDASLTDFPHCDLKQIATAYGAPNTMVLIAGDASAPKELLLFYDRGIHQQGHGQVPDVVSTFAPIQMDDMQDVTCNGPTTLTIVAHQDDDLLFMNPDQLHDIAAGNCVRTVYLTAGDGGRDKFYWLSREQGSEAAYDTMTGNKKGWLQQTVQLPGGQYMTVSNPVGNSRVSLLFLHLPDGNLTGHGFPGSHFESLQKLYENHIGRIYTVDDQSSYSAKELVDAVKAIAAVYQPATLRTQATYMSETFPDHSDHITTSRLVDQAYADYEQARAGDGQASALIHYIGYPIRDMPANIEGDDLAKKQAAFFAYARFDGAVCYSMRDCSSTPTYWAYLGRQYTQP